MNVLPLCLSVYHLCAWCLWEAQVCWDPLRLEVWASCGCWELRRSSGRGASALTVQPSLALQLQFRFLFFKFRGYFNKYNLHKIPCENFIHVTIWAFKTIPWEFLMFSSILRKDFVFISVLICLYVFLNVCPLCVGAWGGQKRVK